MNLTTFRSIVSLSKQLNSTRKFPFSSSTVPEKYIGTSRRRADFSRTASTCSNSSNSANASSPTQRPAAELESSRTENERDAEAADAKEHTSADFILVKFKKPDGKLICVKGTPGKSLYDLVVDNDLDIDGFGACEGTLCCTTCHLIFKKEDYDRIGYPKDEELDMLDLAFDLTDTSRLGCQVFLKKEFGSELEVTVPEGINDSRE